MDRNICVNQVYRDSRSEQQFRLLWVDSSLNTSFIYWLDGQRSVPKRMSLVELEDGIRQGWITEEKDPFSLQNVASEKDQQFRDAVWAKMREALLDEPGIYDRHIRSEHLRRIEKESGERVPNLYRHLCRYWERGKTPDAFLPGYKASGGKGKNRGGISNPRREGSSDFGKTLTPVDFAHFEAAIRKYYLTRKERSLQAVFDRMLGDSYSIVEKDESGRETLHLLPRGELPSIYQFRYWYSNRVDIKEEITRRKGETGYELTARAKLGKNEYGMLGPGSQYQVDATVGDVYLVSQFDRSDIIGRPVMYFCMDTVSHIVTGMYIGLEGPSWLGMAMALYNATTDKVDYCHQFGLEITEEQWPCHHVPAVLLGDRGELESHKADPLVTMLGIRVDNTPPYRGDLKPIIESHFKTINEKVKPFVPGAVMPDDRQRGGRDYRLDAKLTLFEFTQIIIGCVIHYNTKHCLTEYEKSEQMLKSGVEAIPVKLWNWGIRNSSGMLRTFPKETIRLALMPRESGSVTEKGIYFKKLYYSCPEAREALWFENARKNGRYTVNISYDPRNMHTIYVWGKDDSGPYECNLLDWEQRFSGRSLEEVEYEQQKQDLQVKLHEREEKESVINLNKMIDAIVDEAEKLTETSAGKTKTERLADIRENRKEEKEAIRQKEAFTANEKESAKKEETNAPEANDPFEMTKEEWASMSPVDRLIYKDVKRRLGQDVNLDEEC